ncbi:MAG: type IV pili methyl-accepting chemotaxis transducer N-terminal domain-containing protein [Pseudomonadota bacterium]
MPNKSINLAQSLHISLTRRYRLALSLILAILVATFATFTWQTSIGENDAYLINISGQQRMLSQRIALMAKEMRYAQSPALANRYASEMQKSVDKMSSNHSALTSGRLANGKSYALSADLSEMYSGEKMLDQRVSKYLAAANAFLDLYREQGLNVIRSAVQAERNVAETRKGLLGDLNATVTLYEREAKQRIKRFQKLELGFFITGLVILVVELLFIFKPMAELIARRTYDLEKRNAELAELSLKLADKQGLKERALKAAKAAPKQTVKPIEN